MKLDTTTLAALAGLAAAVALHASCSEEPSDPCDGVTCSGHGSCSLREDEARCLCEPAYLVTDSGLECLPREADGDGDTDGDADGDGDGDGDADGDADGDGDGDADGDGDGDLDCAVDAGWGAACGELTSRCDDDSYCMFLPDLHDQGICTVVCGHDSDCPDVGIGVESCILQTATAWFCGVRCESSAECPCGLTCHEDALPDSWGLCYP